MWLRQGQRTALWKYYTGPKQRLWYMIPNPYTSTSRTRWTDQPGHTEKSCTCTCSCSVGVSMQFLEAWRPGFDSQGGGHFFQTLIRSKLTKKCWHTQRWKAQCSCYLSHTYRHHDHQKCFKTNDPKQQPPHAFTNRIWHQGFKQFTKE